MTDTPNIRLAIIEASQAQKHVTHNEAIRDLDALVHLAVLDRDLNTPPLSPASGDRYLVASSATGDWAGKDGEIAAYQDGAWSFHTPKEGWVCWISDENTLMAYAGSAWVGITGSGSLNPLMLGINATADATNRLSVKSDAILFSHDDVTPGSGDIRTKLNKNSTANIASFLFQNGFSARAEIGIIGDDDFQFKVSPDGSTFHEGINIDKDDGVVTLPNGLIVSTLGGGADFLGNVSVTGTIDAPRYNIDATSYISLFSGNPFWNFDANDYMVYNRTSNALEWVIGGVEVAKLNSAGLGVGVSPGDKLQVAGTITSSGVVPRIKVSGTVQTTVQLQQSDGAANEKFFEFYQSADGSFAMRFINDAYTAAANIMSVSSGDRSGHTPLAVRFTSGGLVVGNPTGDNKGSGNINAQGVYDDNSLLSCFVFEAFREGTIDNAKWDDKIPNRIVKGADELLRQKTTQNTRMVEKLEIVDGKAVLSKVEESFDEPVFDEVPMVDERGKPVMHEVFPAIPAIKNLKGEITKPAIAAVMEQKIHREPVMEVIPAKPDKTVTRRHDDMRKFKARLGTEYDPLDIDKYSQHWKDKGHLTSMPNEDKFDPEKGMATGSWIQRLVETVEIQAVHISRLNERLKALETQ